MEELEEGELPSSPEEPRQQSDLDTAPYTPLPRPDVAAAVAWRPRTATNSSTVAHAGDLENRRQDWDGCRTSRPSSNVTSSGLTVAAGRCNDRNGKNAYSSSSCSATSDEDSDEGVKTKMRKTGRSRSSASHGQPFALLAVKFQQERVKSQNGGNNVWGSFLQEDSLNAEMNAIGVGGKSVKSLSSDRGAEAYDYTVAAQAKEKQLDHDLDRYWTKESGGNVAPAIQAGMKRSIKDRLGPRRRGSKGGVKQEEEMKDEREQVFDGLSIPQPGVSRQIPDLSLEVLQQVKEKLKHKKTKEEMKSKTSPPPPSSSSSSSECGDGDDDDDPHVVLGEELANRLCEPKTELMVGMLAVIGCQVGLQVFEKTKRLEANGGMMIKNGARRRTPGGVFLHLVREMGADPNDDRVDGRRVKEFFAQTNNRGGGGDGDGGDGDHRNKKKKKRKKKSTNDKSMNFQQELKSFRKKSAKFKANISVADDEDLKPLADVVSFLTNGASESRSAVTTTTTTAAASRNPNTFEEPEAPPNSVEMAEERTVNRYDDDDFLTEAAETEDIELF